MARDDRRAVAAACPRARSRVGESVRRPRQNARWVKPPWQTFGVYATLQAVEPLGLPPPPGSPEPLLTVEENEVRAGPVPFCQGSKPA
jgi:hypothetical protein